MINLGDAILKITADTAGLEKSLQGVSKKCQDMGKKMMLLGVAITGALIGATVASAKLGDEIAKMSKRTGLGTVALSELRYMSELSGASLESLETGIKRMQRVIIDASDGLSTAVRALERLGLSVEDLMELSPEEQFYTIASAVAGIEDATLKAAVAQEIFGRAGTDLLPILAEGVEGMQAMREEAHEYGRIIDEEAAKKSEAFMDALTRLKESFGKITDAIGTALMPILTDLMENKIVPLISKIADWIRAHEGLVVTLLKIGAILAVSGAILVGLGMLAKAIIAINTALVILHGLAGPAGWVKLAVGIGIAAAAIAGISKLMSSATGGFEASEAETLKSYQYGGRVPGPIGRPVPIIAHGGEEYLGVQNIGRTSMGSMTMNVGLLPGDDVTIRKLARVFKDFMGEDARRTSFPQVQRGYFFGRSSL